MLEESVKFSGKKIENCLKKLILYWDSPDYIKNKIENQPNLGQMLDDLRISLGIRKGKSVK